MKDNRKLWFLRPDIIFTVIVVIVEYIYFRDVQAKSKGYDGVFITALFVLSVVCFLWMLFSAYKNSKKTIADGSDVQQEDKPIAEQYKSIMTKPQAVFLLGTVIYVLLITLIGFLFATIIYLGIIMYFLGEKNIKRLVIISILVPLVIDVLFTKAFRITMPTGLIKMGIGAWF